MFAFSLVGLVLLAVGIVLFFIRRRSARMQAVSVNWPTAPGTVTESTVGSSKDTDNNISYYATVRYSYQVNGASFTGDRVSWGGRVMSQNPDQANAIVARYPAGSTVAAHYNPNKPGQAVLEPQEKGGLKNMTFVMSIFLVLGAIFLAVSFFVTD